MWQHWEWRQCLDVLGAARICKWERPPLRWCLGMCQLASTACLWALHMLRLTLTPHYQLQGAKRPVSAPFGIWSEHGAGG